MSRFRESQVKCEPAESSPFRAPVFLSGTAIHHADKCEPLREAVQRGDVRLSALCRRGYPGRPFPAKMLPEVSTVGFWDAAVPQSWGLGWHRNEGVEFTYLSRGKVDFHVATEVHALVSGDL